MIPKDLWWLNDPVYIELPKASIVAPVSIKKDTPGLSKIPHREGDPTSFEEYLGQERVKRRVQLRLGAMKRGEAFKALFSSPAGIGKTSLARIIAREMAKKGLLDHYFEVVAGKFELKKDLDRFLRAIPDYSLIFIDELHGLTGVVRDSLLPAIQDNVYAFDENTGMTKLSEGLSWIGATTDVGKVHAALQRRLSVITLDPMSFEDRVILASSGVVPMTEGAAIKVAKLSWTPWEVKDELSAVSSDVSKERQEQIITKEHVDEAAAVLGIDKHGLRPAERAILLTLINSPRQIKGEIRYAMSSRALVVAAGVDNKQYLDNIEPKLLKLGYIRISAGVGRELTDKALKEYFL